MSSEALYERYKDALKRGHVASLRGRLEEALTAYAEAATIAPERSTPHTSAAAALLRRKRPADALRHYEAALRLSPRDEAALLGRAQSLAALERRPEAADAFDTLAEHRATAGKLADAVDAARRGLELAEGRERRRTLERLIEQLRAADAGEPGRLALERALQVLEGPAVAQRTIPQVDVAGDAAGAERAGDGEPKAEAPEVHAGRDDEDARHAAPGPDEDVEVGREAAAPTGDVALAGPDDGDAAPDVADRPAAALDTRDVRAALDRDLPAGLDPADLGRAIEEGIARGERPTLDRLLDLAAVLRRDGRTDGALDACYLALSIEPDDVGLHLALVELYDERGWATLASEKLDLLDRIASLDADATAATRVAAARAARG